MSFKKSIPNMLTLGRILVVPIVLGFMVLAPGKSWPMLALFLAASITDFFDGYLARKWNATSPLGTMLDPIADKLLVSLMLVHLVTFTVAPLLPIAAMLLRELYISGLREYLATRQVPLPVSQGGKWKTALQMIAIILLMTSMTFRLIHPREAMMVWDAGEVLLWVAAALSVLTAGAYTRAALPHLIHCKQNV